ncbi:putative metal-nicotianamine transporter [Wickerhamomyces ciferrii]|uniref:Metal-nicotianamine transporter n=1 Tax=Wickerhamomyces ciferrii (strain ATCC 14091 / BCRC 22168 / CBS 111 / JCM 3599 / NBRC 0793 / NRRL Y-1031 F-60-10) TaxID=1206466 RepID=K0KHC5_WICCF|nr:putative metal-nicotianamine transporter [Wickerhamomyces ciferrii]CCH40573.1 putative metal-nicotianamine transporter [Wickerhamomyces ciferrii]
MTTPAIELPPDSDVFASKADIRQVTPRAIITGLFIGSIVLISNFFFAFQTGWISMMSLPSALLAYAIFKQLKPYLSYKFTDVENVFIQSISVAVGTGPLAYGFVGVIPAIEKFLRSDESGTGELVKFSTIDLIIWSTGLAFFGIFFAIPLRKQVVIKEKLPFPSGSATATLISVLNNSEIRHEDTNNARANGDYNELLIETDEESNSNEESSINSNHQEQVEEPVSESSPLLDSSLIKPNNQDQDSYSENITSLIYTFSISSLYTITSYFIPILRNLPIFGSFLANDYLWTFQPSPAYIGQGIIMGLPTVSYMLFGAFLGWGILAPLSKNLGWAPGEIDDWKTGAQGWILWISLAVMVSDSVVAFLVVTIKSIWNFYQKSITSYNATTRLNKNGNPISATGSYDDNEADPQHLIHTNTVVWGLLGSSILCISSMTYLFGTKIVPIYSSIIAIILALFLSVLGVRALGETDLNPVSGIGKLSQLIFALIIPKDHPGSVLVNLVAGAIAEAGAQQAGDLMQDLKTGHLLGASPRAQFIAQLIGTVWSIFLSAVMYKIYNLVYEIPSKIFRIPTAVIWIDCSRLVTGEGLPPYAFEFSLLFGLIFGIISLIKNVFKNNPSVQDKLVWLPSGVAVGVGIYNTPSFTIARFLGGVIAYIWMKKCKHCHEGKTAMIVFSSGLVLGEGVFSIVNMTLTSLGVPHL